MKELLLVLCVLDNQARILPSELWITQLAAWGKGNNLAKRGV